MLARRRLPSGVRPGHHLVGAPPVLLECLALPGEDRDALRLLDGAVRADDRRCGVVLRREDVAARPAHFGTQRSKRLDQHRRLNRHVQRPEIRHPARGFDSPYSLRRAIRPGISCSARIISLRPNGASREVGDAEVFGLGEARQSSIRHGALLRVEQFERTPQPLRRRRSPNRAGALRRRSNQPGDSVNQCTGRAGRPAATDDVSLRRGR